MPKIALLKLENEFLPTRSGALFRWIELLGCGIGDRLIEQPWRTCGSDPYAHRPSFINVIAQDYPSFLGEADGRYGEPRPTRC